MSRCYQVLGPTDRICHVHAGISRSGAEVGDNFMTWYRASSHAVQLPGSSKYGES